MALDTGAETLAAVALLTLTGVVAGFLGYRIRYRGDVVLIAGYDAERVTDDGGLAALVGGVVLAYGAVHVVFGVAPPAQNIVRASSRPRGPGRRDERG